MNTISINSFILATGAVAIFKLKIVQNRLHILHGRIKILEAIAEVIKIIQESDNPKTKLMKRFALDQEQVQDIL